MEPEPTDQPDVVAELRAEIRAAAGAASGVYPPDALESLRDEWPE